MDYMTITSEVDNRRRELESKMIFASSCVESAARRRGISSTEMYRRMKRVGYGQLYLKVL